MKKIAVVLCGLIMAISANCEATVSTDKIAIGGIKPGMSAEELIRIAGQPDEKSIERDDWFYHNGFAVEFDDDSGVIEEIKTRYNTVATPDGVFVGYNESVLTKIYGTADKVKRKQYSTEYTYYSTDYTSKMKFTTVNGTITKISCELDDDIHHG